MSFSVYNKLFYMVSMIKYKYEEVKKNKEVS